MNNNTGFSINARLNELEDPNFIDFLKRRLAQKIGEEILNKSNLDIKNFKGKDTICINLELLKNEDILTYSQLKMEYSFKEVKELEKVYISRKDEVSVISKFYTGEKLTWRERVEALFKGRLYGGSITIEEKEE